MGIMNIRGDLSASDPIYSSESPIQAYKDGLSVRNTIWWSH